MSRPALSGTALTWLFLVWAMFASSSAAQEFRGQIRLLPDDFAALSDEIVLEIKISTLRPDLRISDPEFRLDNLEILSG